MIVVFDIELRIQHNYKQDVDSGYRGVILRNFQIVIPKSNVGTCVFVSMIVVVNP